MADRGIIFSAPMVRALLDGRKTQTRRLLNPQPQGISAAVRNEGQAYGGSWIITMESDRCSVDWKPPAYAPGDRLYVREAWRMPTAFDPFSPMEAHAKVDPFFGPNVFYEADGAVRAAGAAKGTPGRYRHARFMPRWASRLWLNVTDVRVQRVNEISEADAIAEGAEPIAIMPNGPQGNPSDTWLSYRAGFETLWNSLHTKPGERWEDNPWIVAISFDVHRGNIDTVSSDAPESAGARAIEPSERGE